MVPRMADGSLTWSSSLVGTRKVVMVVMYAGRGVLSVLNECT